MATNNRKSPRDLIEESKKAQEERLQQIFLAKKKKEEETAHMIEVQNNLEQSIINEQGRESLKGNGNQNHETIIERQEQQRFTGNKKKDNKTVANWQQGRNKEHERKQAISKMKNSGTKSNQPSLTSNRGGSDRKPNGEKMSPKERFAEIMKKRQEEELKKKIKQRAAQLAKQAAQKAAQVAAQVGKIIIEGFVQAGIWMASAILASVGWIGCIGAIVIVIVVVIIAYIYQTCNDNMLYSSICTGLSWVGKAAAWIGF